MRYPPSTEDAKFRTRERMLELRERIMNGTKFEVLARMYSEDPGSAIRGGEMDPMPKEVSCKPFADAWAKLKPGQISEVVETEFGYHLILLLDQVGNLYHCRHILLKPQFTDSEIKAAFTTLDDDSSNKEILAGKSTFADAVAKYSEDKYSNRNGDVATNIELLEAMNQAIARAATTKFLKVNRSQTPGGGDNALKDMKPGDISSDAFASQDICGNALPRQNRTSLTGTPHAYGEPSSEDFLKIEEIALKKKHDADFGTWLKNRAAGMFTPGRFRISWLPVLKGLPYLLKQF
ncbi:MAG: peptidylprolyl isomerase [Alistipes indistinctus]